MNEAVTANDFTSYCVTAPTDTRLGDASGSQICGLYDVIPSQFGRINTRALDYDKFGGGSQIYNGFDLQATARLKRGAFIQGGVNIGRMSFDLCNGDFAGSVATISLPLGNGVATSETLNFPNKRFCDTDYPYQLQGKLSGAYTMKYRHPAVGHAPELPRAAD